MKKSILIIMLFMLSACAEFSGMAYDPTLHMQEAHALVSAKKARLACDTTQNIIPYINQINRDVDVIAEYQSHINGGEQLSIVIADTKLLVESMEERYKEGNVSPTYCRIKTDFIVTAINSMMNITGRKQ